MMETFKKMLLIKDELRTINMRNILDKREWTYLSKMIKD